MFSSNQVLEISGDLSHKNDLRDALEFALRKEGSLECFTRTLNPTKCVFQISENGHYCIGWTGGGKEPPRGWQMFQFDFDIEIISSIIVQHLSKQKIEESGGDGSTKAGFLLKPIDFTSAGVENPFYGIVMFCPYNCYYAK